MESQRTRVCGARTLILILSVACVAALACAHQPSPPPGMGLPGFFTGVLHGFLILFNLLASLFTDARIYAYPNSGGWYDFGFVIGAMMFLGGGGAGSRKCRKRE